MTHFLSQYGLPLLAIVIMLESCGVPLPGETALITFAVLATQGRTTYAGADRLLPRTRSSDSIQRYDVYAELLVTGGIVALAWRSNDTETAVEPEAGALCCRASPTWTSSSRRSSGASSAARS